MNTEQEITVIKERLDHLEASLEKLCQAFDAADAEAFDFIEFTYEKGEGKSGSDRYTYAVTIRNTTTEDQGFSGYVLFLDSDGVELHRDGIDYFSIPAGSTHTQHGYADIFDQMQKLKITDLEADIFALAHSRPCL